MKEEQEYLSDEELNALIADLEADDMIMAPPSILERIEEVADSDHSNLPDEREKNEKIIEFRKYCIRVITSVAAAVVLVFLVPTVTGLRDTDLPSKETVVGERNVPTKAEVMAGNRIMSNMGSSHFLSEGLIVKIVE